METDILSTIGQGANATDISVALAIQPDGKIVLAGNSSVLPALARYWCVTENVNGCGCSSPTPNPNGTVTYSWSNGPVPQYSGTDGSNVQVGYTAQLVFGVGATAVGLPDVNGVAVLQDTQVRIYDYSSANTAYVPRVTGHGKMIFSHNQYIEIAPDGSKMIFDGTGKLVQKADSAGNLTNCIYDSNGVLTDQVQVTNAIGSGIVGVRMHRAVLVSLGKRAVQCVVGVGHLVGGAGARLDLHPPRRAIRYRLRSVQLQK